MTCGRGSPGTRSPPWSIPVAWFDAGQDDGPEPAQPAKQAGVSGRADRELPGAGEFPDGIQRGGDVHVCVGDPRRR